MKRPFILCTMVPERAPHRQWIFFTALFILIYVLFTSIEPARVEEKTVLTDRPVIIAHRCGAQPEATVFACRETARRKTADFLEMDVWLTKDGRLAVIHDEKIDRTTDGSGRVEDYTMAELQKFDAGYRYSPDGKSFPYRGKGIRIEPLESFLDEFRGYRFYIEIKSKSPDAVTRFVEIIRGRDLEDMVVVGSFRGATMDELERQAPRIARTGSFPETAAWVLLEKLRLNTMVPIRAHTLTVTPVRFLLDLESPAFVAAAHRQNLKVHVWTINDPARMRQLLRSRVDGILTDRPDLLHEIMTEELYPSRPRPELKF